MRVINISDATEWASVLRSQPPRPLLVHLNADTTWLLQLPHPATATAGTAANTLTPARTAPPSRTGGRRRAYFNLLIDPWLRGPQSDVASWFSTQTHVVPPALATLAELQAVLKTLEGGGDGGGGGGGGAESDSGTGKEEIEEGQERSYIDAVAISHEFTDHCHKATLLELPRDTPIYAADVAADLIRSWGYFSANSVITALGLAKDTPWTFLSHERLPPWLRISRLITPGNSLYYHSAIVIAFALDPSSSAAESIVYSPHGISAKNVAALPSCGISTLALLHGLHDVKLSLMKQLNLGALNGVEAARACGARYWIGTHDEEKTGKGVIAPLLRRTRYTLQQAVVHDEKEEEGWRQW